MYYIPDQSSSLIKKRLVTILIRKQRLHLFESYRHRMTVIRRALEHLFQDTNSLFFD